LRSDKETLWKPSIKDNFEAWGAMRGNMPKSTFYYAESSVFVPWYRVKIL